MIGKVEKINLWGSSNGYFFDVNNQAYAVTHGKPNFSVGETIEFEKSVAFGTDGKKFVAKNIKKLATSRDIGQAAIELQRSIGLNVKDLPIEAMFDAMKPKNRDQQIEQLALMKMATRLVVASMNPDIVYSSEELAKAVRKQADELKAVL
jgi:hypothetical protein